MRVALVSEHASPIAPVGGEDGGGQNVHVAALANELARRGIDVIVYTRRDDAGLPRQVRLGERAILEYVDAGPAGHLARDDLLPFIPRFGEELARSWRKEPPDVIHSHYWMSGLAAVAAATPLRIPVVQTFHALGATKRRHQGFRDPSPPVRVRAEARLASCVDAVVATSRAEVAELRRCGGRPRLMVTVPCGVDTTLFTPAADRHTPSARVVSIGRLVERKGVDDVIRSLVALPNVRLVVAGGTGRPDDPEANRLKALARRLEVAQRVEFIGPVEHTEVPALLRSADVVACVPWYEPFGMVAVEAMACAVPVVAAHVGGLRDTVVHNETGIHVPARDPSRLALALRALLEDGSLRARLGVRGSERAAAHYTWSRVTDSLLQVYKQVVEDHRP